MAVQRQFFCRDSQSQPNSLREIEDWDVEDLPFHPLDISLACVKVKMAEGASCDYRVRSSGFSRFQYPISEFNDQVRAGNRQVGAAAFRFKSPINDLCSTSSQQIVHSLGIFGVVKLADVGRTEEETTVVRGELKVGKGIFYL